MYYVLQATPLQGTASQELMEVNQTSQDHPGAHPAEVPHHPDSQEPPPTTLHQVPEEGEEIRQEIEEK